jgi:hypothetical protein
VAPEASIQAAVDHAGDGAAFCLEEGLDTMQVVRPKPGQSFYWGGERVLRGSRCSRHLAGGPNGWRVGGGSTLRSSTGELCKHRPVTCPKASSAAHRR